MPGFFSSIARLSRSGSNPRDSSCNICGDEWLPGSQEIRRHNTCGGMWHVECISSWTGEGNTTCPNCRGQIAPSRASRPAPIHNTDFEPTFEQIMGTLNGRGTSNATARSSATQGLSRSTSRSRSDSNSSRLRQSSYQPTSSQRSSTAWVNSFADSLHNPSRGPSLVSTSLSTRARSRPPSPSAARLLSTSPSGRGLSAFAADAYGTTGANSNSSSNSSSSSRRHTNPYMLASSSSSLNPPVSITQPERFARRYAIAAPSGQWAVEALYADNAPPRRASSISRMPVRPARSDSRPRTTSTSGARSGRSRPPSGYYGE